MLTNVYGIPGDLFLKCLFPYLGKVIEINTDSPMKFKEHSVSIFIFYNPL